MNVSLTPLTRNTYTDYYNKAFKFKCFPHLRGRVLVYAGLFRIVCLCVGATWVSSQSVLMWCWMYKKKTKKNKVDLFVAAGWHVATGQ